MQLKYLMISMVFCVSGVSFAGSGCSKSKSNQGRYESEDIEIKKLASKDVHKEYNQSDLTGIIRKIIDESDNTTEEGRLEMMRSITTIMQAAVVDYEASGSSELFAGDKDISSESLTTFLQLALAAHNV